MLAIAATWHAGNQSAVLAHQRRRRPAPLLDACRDGGDLGIRVGPGVFRIRDQPVDRPALDLRPCRLATAFDFPSRLARGRAHALTEGKCWRFCCSRRSTAGRLPLADWPLGCCTNRLRVAHSLPMNLTLCAGDRKDRRPIGRAIYARLSNLRLAWELRMLSILRINRVLERIHRRAVRSRESYNRSRRRVARLPATAAPRGSSYNCW